MNESMNFGSIGFGNVSSGDNSTNVTQPIIEENIKEEVNQATEPKEEKMPDLLAGVKEAQAKMEEEI